MEETLSKEVPLVSVVMANYNNVRFLPEAIESVLAQTYRNFEFFIVDDGSTDNSSEVIKTYLEKDSRIHYIQNERNLGQSLTRNIAIELASGKYVVIVDSDDICLPNRLERQVLFMENNSEIGVLGTGFYTFTANKNQYKPGYVQSDGLRNGKVWVHNPTCMIRKSVYESFGYYDPKFDNAEDVELYFRWFSNGVKFHNLDERLLKYRVSHGNNVSDVRKKQQVWKAFVINILAIFKHRIRFSFTGYLYTLELFLYYVYLFLGLGRLYKRNSDALSYNVKAHDKVSKRYEKEHVEIYNHIEQERLKNSLGKALGDVKTNADFFRCLDFGCGAGNITRYLLEHPNATVVSADISLNFLDLVRDKYANALAEGRLETLLLNGKNLSSIPDASFDFVSLYSVLHHVPDYLSIVEELVRILKPGGVIFIDHEASPMVWDKNREYSHYLMALNRVVRERTALQRLTHMLTPLYWLYFVKGRINPRFRIEGDIHVFQDDHIEWREIEKIFMEKSMKVLRTEDYLLFNKYCPNNLYLEYKGKVNDIRLVIARKSIDL